MVSTVFAQLIVGSFVISAIEPMCLLLLPLQANLVARGFLRVNGRSPMLT